MNRTLISLSFFFFFFTLIIGDSCPNGYIGTGCRIPAEVGACKSIAAGELCVGLNFPDSCDVTANFYMRGIVVNSKTIRLNITSDVCFHSIIPALNCGVCLSLGKNLEKDAQGKIKTVCPEIKVTCPNEVNLKLKCISPRIPLSANCVNTAAPTPRGGSSSQAQCVPACGPGGACTSTNKCTCKAGWSEPYCLTQENQDSGSSGKSDTDNGNKNIGLIVLGSIAGALVVLGVAITAYHFWKRRIENQRAGYDEMNDLIDDDDDDKLAFVRS